MQQLAGAHDEPLPLAGTVLCRVSGLTHTSRVPRRVAAAKSARLTCGRLDLTCSHARHDQETNCTTVVAGLDAEGGTRRVESSLATPTPFGNERRVPWLVGPNAAVESRRGSTCGAVPLAPCSTAAWNVTFTRKMA
jgi:hypothetical protein